MNLINLALLDLDLINKIYCVIDNQDLNYPTDGNHPSLRDFFKLNAYGLAGGRPRLIGTGGLTQESRSWGNMDQNSMGFSRNIRIVQNCLKLNFGEFKME